MSNLITSMCDDCKYVKYSFDGGSTKCGYHGKKDCNFTPREKKDLAKDREIIKSEAIKDFAERLKSKLANLSVQTKTHGRKTTPNYVDDIANQILHDVVPQEIDNLVKEMKRGCK